MNTLKYAVGYTVEMKNIFHKPLTNKEKKSIENYTQELKRGRDFSK